MANASAFRILITGGNGFVGRYLISALAARPERYQIIVGTHRAGLAPPGTGPQQIELDVTDAERVRSVIASEQPTHLFHLAAISAVSAAQEQIRTTWKVNFEGTLNVALAVLEAAPDCRMLYCSSAEVYGNSFRSNHPLDERALLQPVSFYGVSKAAADLMVGQMANGGLRAVRLRAFNHTGAGQRETFAVPAFAAQIARIERGEQEPVMRVGNLTSRRDYLDVDDVVEAYIRAGLRFDDLPAGCVINIASGQALQMADILKTLLSMATKKIEVVEDSARMRASDTPVVMGDASLARRLLEWTPKHDFSHTLRSILDYFRSSSELL